MPRRKINWHNHIDQVYNLIRGCNPAPAAWTMLNGKKLRHFRGRKKHPSRTFSQVKGKVGAVTRNRARSFFVSTQGGQIEVFTLRAEDGKKLSAPSFVLRAGPSRRACVAAGREAGGSQHRCVLYCAPQTAENADRAPRTGAVVSNTIHTGSNRAFRH